MPWREVDTVDLRREFVGLASERSANFSELCRRYGVSRKTGYKWLARYERDGDAGLCNRSRRPHRQPKRTSEGLEQLVLSYRARYPEWGGRKLARVMRNEGCAQVPSASTITEILRRNGRLHAPDAVPQPNYCRFEHPAPNDLWQMDFKGDFALAQGRCHPLTILDDHSRFALCLHACQDEKQDTVRELLRSTFQRYGQPLRMTMDNGAPWGSHACGQLTQLTAWLIEHGIAVSHSRPYHPQTQGKDERFHRTLNGELLQRQSFKDHLHCQRAFDWWRPRYNTERPHEALNMDCPIDRYEPSPRGFRQSPPSFEYPPGDQVRKVAQNLQCSFKYRYVFVGKGLQHKYVAFRPTKTDGIYDIYFCHHRVRRIDLNEHPKRLK